MANTYVDYTAVASQTDYNFSFEYLRDDHVKVKVNDVIVTNYTIVTSPTPTKIRFNTAPSAGATIKIYRDSRGDFSPLVDFVNGSVLTESELDESYKHNLFVSQEASEGTGNELLNKKGGANYDAEGNKIINLGTPTAGTDAANKGYVDQTIDNAIALGGSPAIVSLGGYDVTALGSLTPRSLADRFTDVANVLDFIPSSQHAYIASNDTASQTSSLVTSGIQSAINNTTSNRIYIPKGTYLLNAQLTISSEVVLYGEGILKEGTLTDATILVDNTNNVGIDGLTFEGPETLSTWNALTAGERQSYKAFVKFDDCKNGYVINTRSSGKRGVVYLYDCQKMQIQGNRHDGFFGDITTPASDNNYYSAFHCSGGRENHLTNNEAYSVGSVVLLARDSSFNIVSNTSGREMHDNGIYNSSGDSSSFLGGTFENTLGSGVKARGRSHVVSGFTIKGCNVGVNLTGNGTTPDAFNSNGFGTVCSNNTIASATGHGIQVSGQDGLYARDFVISNNTIESHLGTAGFAAINATMEQGLKLTNNIVRGASSCDYAIGVFGVGSSNRGVNFDVSGNSVSTAAQALRVQNVDDSIVSNNIAYSISGTNGLEFRLCDNNFITGNTLESGRILLSSASGEECLNNSGTNNNASDLFSDEDNNVTALIIENEFGSFNATYTTDGTGFTIVVNAGSFVIGETYTILTVGTTDFTLIGATDNNIGTQFTATGSGTGTGTAEFSNITYTDQQAFYTKIGRLVTVSGKLRTSAVTVGSASGNVCIGGLPFTVSDGGTGANGAGSLSTVSAFNTGFNPLNIAADRNSTVLKLYYRTASNSADTNLPVSALSTGSDSNRLYFTCTYATDE